MTSTSKPLTTSAASNWLMSPIDFFERLLQVAPNKLDQQINPGWTFGNLISVTEQNSSAPDTERNIVAVHSYGRQLGRVLDAVAALIEDLPEAKQQSPAFKKLADLQEEIAKIKSRSAARRLDRLAADLEELRKTDIAEYQRVAKEVRVILDR